MDSAQDEKQVKEEMRDQPSENSSLIISSDLLQAIRDKLGADSTIANELVLRLLDRYAQVQKKLQSTIVSLPSTQEGVTPNSEPKGIQSAIPPFKNLYEKEMKKCLNFEISNEKLSIENNKIKDQLQSLRLEVKSLKEFRVHFQAMEKQLHSTIEAKTNESRAVDRYKEKEVRVQSQLNKFKEQLKLLGLEHGAVRSNLQINQSQFAEMKAQLRKDFKMLMARLRGDEVDEESPESEQDLAEEANARQEQGLGEEITNSLTDEEQKQVQEGEQKQEQEEEQKQEQDGEQKQEQEGEQKQVQEGEQRQEQEREQEEEQELEEKKEQQGQHEENTHEKQEDKNPSEEEQEDEEYTQVKSESQPEPPLENIQVIEAYDPSQFSEPSSNPPESLHALLNQKYISQKMFDAVVQIMESPVNSRVQEQHDQLQKSQLQIQSYSETVEFLIDFAKTLTSNFKNKADLVEKLEELRCNISDEDTSKRIKQVLTRTPLLVKDGAGLGVAKPLLELNIDRL